MNIALVVRVLGTVLNLAGGLMMIPFAISLIYREPEGHWFLLIGLGSFAVGWLIRKMKPKSDLFYIKEGCAATALTWILISIVSALPLCLSGAIPDFHNALFEMISGYTTTGSSILGDVESLPMCCLFWRSLTHWIGGMGILVFLLAISPIAGNGSKMKLMKAESPGPTVGKMTPKVRETAKILYLLYIVLSVINLLFLLAGKMPLMEALMTVFGTAGTGGFGVKNDSLGSYSPYLQWVTAIFMMLFGMNFNAYFFISRKKIRDALKMEEIRWYLIMILVATVLIVLNGAPGGSLSYNIRHAFFQVSSLTTSTGFSSVDFDLWPGFSKSVLIFVMFVGACAGSTGGGLKVQRVIVMVKNAFREVGFYAHPRNVRRVKFEGKPVEEETVASINTYLVVFFGIFIASFFLVSLEGRDPVTNFTAVLTCINNMGPGFAQVGPTRNFADLTLLSKYVLMFDMLAGRLEIYPLLLIFSPGLWADTFSRGGRN